MCGGSERASPGIERQQSNLTVCFLLSMTVYCEGVLAVTSVLTVFCWSLSGNAISVTPLRAE